MTTTTRALALGAVLALGLGAGSAHASDVTVLQSMTSGMRRMSAAYKALNRCETPACERARGAGLISAAARAVGRTASAVDGTEVCTISAIPIWLRQVRSDARVGEYVVAGRWAAAARQITISQREGRRLIATIDRDCGE